MAAARHARLQVGCAVWASHRAFLRWTCDFVTRLNPPGNMFRPLVASSLPTSAMLDKISHNALPPHPRSIRIVRSTSSEVRAPPPHGKVRNFIHLFWVCSCKGLKVDRG